ncbi:hypothetical protein SDC9_160404 [bioreactor metagenome]|uniref:Uncharacterized protein n=1 Tax=bioreactor metagenome TaxID=1076179 RepID=A0A645FKZ0_9ZZZZ
MPLRNGLDAAAHDLADVSCGVDREADDARGERRKIDAERRKSEIDQEKLDQQRRSADDVDVCRREGSYWRIRQDAKGAHEDAEKSAEDHRKGGPLQRDQRACQKHVKVRRNGGKIKRHAVSPPLPERASGSRRNGRGSAGGKAASALSAAA